MGALIHGFFPFERGETAVIRVRLERGRCHASEYLSPLSYPYDTSYRNRLFLSTVYSVLFCSAMCVAVHAAINTSNSCDVTNRIHRPSDTLYVVRWDVDGRGIPIYEYHFWAILCMLRGMAI